MKFCREPGAVRPKPARGPAGRRLGRHLAGTLLPALVLSLWGAAPLQARAGCQLQQMDIPVHMVGRRPVATLMLNGTPVQLLVDSGAFFSFLSPATAEQLKLRTRSLPWGMTIEGYTGKVAAQRTRVEKVGLQGAELSDVEFVVGGNELGDGIQGLLGRNILAAADTEYDLAHGWVKLSFPKGDCEKNSFAYWAGDAPVVVVPLEDDKRTDLAMRVEVQVNGKPVMALLDTGATSTSLSLKTARRSGIRDQDMKPDGRTGGAGEGLVRSWTAQVASFELGGEKIVNNTLGVDDVHGSDQGVLIGLDYFLSHRIYVSRLQRQMYVTWNGGPVFARNQAAEAAADARFAAAPAALPNDDADALARRGAAAIAAGNHSRALEDLNRACELAPGVASYFFARARLHLAMDNQQAALADLDESLRLDPALSQARLRRAWLRLVLDDQEGARADLAPLDASLPTSSDSRSSMAELYARLGLVPEALRQFDLWVGSHARDNHMASVLNNRCWLRTRLNLDLPLALKDCTEAVDRDDGSASYRDSLAWTYLRLGEPQKARKAFDRAIDMKPQAFSHYGRALALLRLNDKTGAEKDLAIARRLQPEIDAEVQREGFEPAPASPPTAAAGS